MGKFAINSIPRRLIDASRKSNSRSNLVRVLIRECFHAGSRSPESRENCARHPRDENTMMVAAGASEQQKQHELEEESGFAGMGFKGGSGSEEREREEKKQKRPTSAAEEKIEGEIPSESSRCDPV